MKRQSQGLEPLAKGLVLYLENEKRGARTEPGEEQDGTEKCYINKREDLPSPKHRAKDKDLYESSSKDHSPSPAPVGVEPVRQVPHRAPLQDERLSPCLVVSLLLLLLNKRQVPRHLPLPRPHSRRHLVLPQGTAWFRAHAFNTTAVRQVPLTVEVQVVPEEDPRRLFDHHLTFAAPEYPRGRLHLWTSTKKAPARKRIRLKTRPRGRSPGHRSAFYSHRHLQEENVSQAPARDQ